MQVVKNPPANSREVRNVGSVPELGRSPGGGRVNTLQHSCLKNPHGLRSLAGYSPQGCHKKLDIGHDWNDLTHMHTRFVVQSLTHVQLFSTPWTAALQASLSFSISLSLLELKSTESVMPSNHFILCHPLLLLPSIFPSIRVFSSESILCIGWPKCWSFSFSISPSNEYSGLVSFRMDWFDLLAVQGTLKSLLQHHNQKASILRLLWLP